MTECNDLTIVWSMLGISVVVLLVYHWCEYSPRRVGVGLDSSDEVYRRCFQYEHVCNFRTYSHEMFIIPFWMIGFLCGVIQFGLGCETVSVNVTFAVVYGFEFLFVVCVIILQDRSEGRRVSGMDDLDDL